MSTVLQEIIDGVREDLAVRAARVSLDDLKARVQRVAQAHDALAVLTAKDGVKVRVVSMPCIELFEAQSQDYRDEVLPRAVRARLAVEPGATISWWKWVGIDGDVLGLDRFGASAPGTTVLEKLIGPMFGRIADSFIDAFVKRAAAVHGPGA